MAENNPPKYKLKKPDPPREEESARMPSNAELLHELRLHGAPPKVRHEPSSVSRRTRDFLLLAGCGSIGIVFACFRVLGDSDPAVTWRLAMTGVALLCGLLWFIFYGVMSRY